MNGDGTYDIVDFATIVGAIIAVIGFVWAAIWGIYVYVKSSWPTIELTFDKWASSDRFSFSFLYRNQLTETVTVESIALQTLNGVAFVGAKIAGRTGPHSQIGVVQELGRVLELQRELAANRGDPSLATFQEEYTIDMNVEKVESLLWPLENQLTFKVRDRRSTGRRTRQFSCSLAVPMDNRPRT